MATALTLEQKRSLCRDGYVVLRSAVSVDLLPWERSKHAMCNMWSEWEGMQEVVALAG